MKKVAKILIAGGVCSVFWAMPASASTNLETSSSLAGISVALNNFYASTEEPEQALASVFDAAAATSVASGGGGVFPVFFRQPDRFPCISLLCFPSPNAT